MSTKTITITVREHPPCEFDSPEDLERYVETRPKVKEVPADWSDIIRRIPKKRKKA